MRPSCLDSSVCVYVRVTSLEYALAQRGSSCVSACIQKMLDTQAFVCRLPWTEAPSSQASADSKHMAATQFFLDANMLAKVPTQHA
eukprot:1139488-Pelagomonas_calceolata.AAC.3